MKKKGKIILNIFLLAFCLALFVPVYMYWQKNDISKKNKLRTQAKDEYFAREFLKAYKTYELLIDSLKVVDNAASLNYANSAFMSSNILLNGLYGSVGKTKVADSTLQDLADFSQSEYGRLSTVEEAKIASMAYNQLGYSALKRKDALRDKNADSTLAAALEHFKNALRRNPENDSARYNYELVKRLAAYPETVMNQTRSLVNQRRYVEAADLLESAMRRHPALEKQKEYLTRLKQIVKIDSIYTRPI
jgi:tetratricopeptide (TPR) repeat protein